MLRATACTNIAAVQKILRHSTPTITTQVYGHLSPDYLRGEIARLKLLPEPKRFATYLLTALKPTQRPPRAIPKAQHLQTV